jgi:AraC-like DNA-binding protein
MADGLTPALRPIDSDCYFYLMLFRRIEPSAQLEKVVECYWIIESDEAPHTQKIIPDGFPELIFHYKDNYKINISGRWELQSKYLLAGQIRKFFHLKNTGTAGMIGIKLKPTALVHMYNLNMREYTDRVVNLETALGSAFNFLINEIKRTPEHDQWIKTIEEHLASQTPAQPEAVPDDAVNLIFQSKGLITVKELCSQLHLTERSLERIFAKYIGLSPKFYSRIIRFSHIFDLLQKKDPSWNDLVYETGYYDQSHFIRNFKAFTGEDPSKYFFNEPTLANFFMKKGK